MVRVFDVLRTDADPWSVMEYVPSRSLQDTLAMDGPFPPVRAAEIGLGMLNALRAAHRNGVVHRDVKPGNVLIGEDGLVVLTDFGLATVPGDPNVTRTGLERGHPAALQEAAELQEIRAIGLERVARQSALELEVGQEVEEQMLEAVLDRGLGDCGHR